MKDGVKVYDPQRISWKVDEYVLSKIEAAKKNAEEIINNSDSELLYFEKYGADFIKKHGMHRICICGIININYSQG